MKTAKLCVRLWIRLYTLGLSEHDRAERIDEIESDLWEFEQDPRERRSHAAPLHLLARLLFGMPDDLLWRLERRTSSTTTHDAALPFSRHPMVTASAFTCSLVIHILAGAVLVVGVGSGFEAAAQTPIGNSTSPIFEVASIKPNPARSTGPTRIEVSPGGRYVATNIPIRLLIGQAFRVSSLELVGGPDWISTEHFDIIAKSDADLLPKAGTRPLDAALRALLADRFKLVVHRETRDRPIFALLVARTDGHLGPQLTQSTRTDCEEVLRAARERGGGPPLPPPASGEAPPCGARSMPGSLWADSLTLSQIAGFLSGEVNRVVQDRTGLKGLFNVRLQWSPERSPSQPSVAPSDLPPIDQNGPSIFTAVREQLGLKLEPSTGQIEVLVIDRIEKPTPD